MAIMRVEKNGNYTVMSNYHLRDSRLSLKAKGLLSVMLSLPAEWDFTLAGLSYINKEGIDAIRAAVNELVKAGYIIRTKVRNAAGQLVDMEYSIYELPQDDNKENLSSVAESIAEPRVDASNTPSSDKPTLGKPILENPMSENLILGSPTLEKPTQSNIDRLSAHKKKKDKTNTKTSNPNQSNTYPSITENMQNKAGSIKPQSLALQTDIESPPETAQTQTNISSVCETHRDTPTVQQMYLSEENNISGMRRRLSYSEIVQKIKRQIDYWDLIEGKNKDEIENILSIMVEVLTTQCEFFTISGKKYPADLVHQRFTQITSITIDYVLECFHNCGSNIRNIKQYLIAALFNAPATCESYYGAAVRRDFAFLR